MLVVVVFFSAATKRRFQLCVMTQVPEYPLVGMYHVPVALVVDANGPEKVALLIPPALR